MKLSVTLTRRRVIAAIVLVAVAPFAVGASGLVSIGASSGHFAPVGWFLHWTMQQTVSRRSWLVEKPEDLNLSDPALVQRGSGHFATGCAPCHAAPGVRQSEVVEHMTPMPPQLHVGDRIAEWEDRELFWIVQHGIKYSGMPAWPAQERPDEVWSMVAFLRALPGMTPERYRELALGIDAGGAPDEVDMEAGAEALGGLDGIMREAVADCARCHGTDGLGRGPLGAFPGIAGQPQAYLAATLKAFQMGTRQSGYMQSAAARYDDAVLERLATYYAGQPAAAPGDATVSEAAGEVLAEAASEPAQAKNVRPMTEVFQIDPAAATGFSIGRNETLALGRRIAETGLPERKIAACDSCHGPDGIARNQLFPRLDGHPFWYLKTHLELWKEGHRGGTRFAHLMDPIAINMTEEQIEAVSLWYESRDVRPIDQPAR